MCSTKASSNGAGQLAHREDSCLRGRERGPEKLNASVGRRDKLLRVFQAFLGPTALFLSHSARSVAKNLLCCSVNGIGMCAMS